MRLFIGDLPFTIKDKEVITLLKPFVTIESLELTHKTGKNARTFGFITIAEPNNIETVLAKLNTIKINLQAIKVSVEQIKKPVELTAQDTLEDVPTIEPVKDSQYQEVKAKLKKRRKRGVLPWEKRKGRGTNKAWKKKPGGIKKKFASSARSNS